MTKWLFRYIMTNVDNCIDESIKAKSLKSDDAKLEGLHWENQYASQLPKFGYYPPISEDFLLGGDTYH